MSKESVVEIITRALTDAGFRSQLFADPDAALAGHDLTGEERASLSALQEDALDAFASEVEERISKFAPPYVPVRPSEGDLINVAQMFRAELASLDLDELLRR